MPVSETPAELRPGDRMPHQTAGGSGPLLLAAPDRRLGEAPTPLQLEHALSGKCAFLPYFNDTRWPRMRCACGVERDPTQTLEEIEWWMARLNARRLSGSPA